MKVIKWKSKVQNCKAVCYLSEGELVIACVEKLKVLTGAWKTGWLGQGGSLFVIVLNFL